MTGEAVINFLDNVAVSFSPVTILLVPDLSKMSHTLHEDHKLIFTPNQDRSLTFSAYTKTVMILTRLKITP